MAKTHTYLVSFSPTERQSWGGYTVQMSLMVGGKNHEVEAASFADLERQVRRLAKEFGQTCSPYVRLKDKKARKPAGFDAWDRTINIIDFVPEPAEAASTVELMEKAASSAITLTKAKALEIQASQIEHYSRSYGDRVRDVVKAATTADLLEDGVEYDIVTINRHIPRGGFIEALLA